MSVDVKIRLSNARDLVFQLQRQDTWASIRERVLLAFGCSSDLLWRLTVGRCLVGDHDPFVAVLSVVVRDLEQDLWICRLHHYADIHFRTLDGSRVTLQTWTYEIIYDIKERLQETLENSSCSLSLVSDGEHLGDEYTLWDYGFRHGDEIQLIITPLRHVPGVMVEWHHFDDYRHWPW